MVKLLLGVTENAAKRLREEAKQRQLTMSDLLRRILDDWFAKRDDEKKEKRK
jgi:class 3 adenylate cyclase